MKLIRNIFITLILFILVAPITHAASTRLELVFDDTEIITSVASEIEIRLCSNETVNTLDITVDASKSTAIFQAEIKGNNDVLQIITEKSYDPETKKARIVGGSPGNIPMEADGCATIGSLKITPSTEGKIIATIDFEETQLLGENTFDTNQTASIEKKSKIEIPVISQPALPAGNEAVHATSETATGKITIETLSGSASLVWDPVDGASKYIVLFNTKEAYETNNTDLRSLEILGAANSRYTLAALEANTEYVVMIKMVDSNGTETSLTEITGFTTKEIPTAAVSTTQETIAQETSVITAPELTVETPLAPQPVAYIVQEPQSQQFMHAASGPEHIIIGIITIVLIGWVYIRKRLA